MQPTAAFIRSFCDIIIFTVSKGVKNMGIHIWPLLLVIAANTFYHICSKSLPQNANLFISLFVTYTVGAILSLLIYFFGENPVS